VPHPLKKLILSDDAVATPDQMDEDIEDLRLDVHDASASAQLSPGDIDLAIPKRENHIIPQENLLRAHLPVTTSVGATR
jgi:hypothetical protein